jgi:hypothetical protein
MMARELLHLVGININWILGRGPTAPAPATTWASSARLTDIVEFWSTTSDHNGKRLNVPPEREGHEVISSPLGRCFRR